MEYKFGDFWGLATAEFWLRGLDLNQRPQGRYIRP